MKDETLQNQNETQNLNPATPLSVNNEETKNTENETAETEINEELLPQFKGWKGKSAQFIASQIVSLFGSMLVRYAIMWYVTLQTKSGGAITLMTLCIFLPQMLISLFAGVWADKFSRKTLIMISDLFIASSSLILALYFLLGGTHIWMMFFVTALSSLGTGVQMPAINAFVSQIVPKNKLVKVNSILTSLQSVIQLLAPAISAFLVVAVDLYYLFGIDVITAVTAVIIILFLKVNPYKKSDEKKHIFTDFKDGVKYVAKHKYLRDLMLYMTFLMMFLTPIAMLTTLQITRTFGANLDESALYLYLAIAEIAFSAGMILGGVIMGITGGFKNRGHSISLATVAFGVLTVLLGLAGFLQIFYFYVAIMFIIGIFLPLFNVSTVTLVQENVELSMMGRVFGFYTIVNSTIMPLAMLGYGPLSDVLSIEWILIITGIIQALFLIFALKGSWNKIKQNKKIEPVQK